MEIDTKRLGEQWKTVSELMCMVVIKYMYGLFFA